MIEKLRRWERVVSQTSKQGESTFCDARIAVRLLDDDNISHKTHGIDVIAKWSQTSRGGRQVDLLNTIEPPVCSSVYGLCE